MLVADEDSCKEVQSLMLGEFGYGLPHTSFHLVDSSAFGFTLFQVRPHFFLYRHYDLLDELNLHGNL